MSEPFAFLLPNFIAVPSHVNQFCAHCLSFVSSAWAHLNLRWRFQSGCNRRGRKFFYRARGVFLLIYQPSGPKDPQIRVYFMQNIPVNMRNEMKQTTTPLLGFYIDDRGASCVTDSERAALFLLCVKWEQDASSCTCVRRELGTLNQCSSTPDVA